MPACIGHIALAVTSVVFAYTLYSWVSTFVWTTPTGVIIVWLFFVIVYDTCDSHTKAGKHNTAACLKGGALGSCIFVVGGLVIAGIAAGLQYGFIATKCNFQECCTSNWIPANITGLSLELNKKLYGQHLVTGSVVNHLRSHIEGYPQKALILSFNGPTGTGKTFVSQMIVEHMYYNGMRSKYVHLISPTKDFPHADMIEAYKDELKRKVETAVRECPQSIFIIDEMDKLLPGLIDIIRPYVELHEQVDGLDYRKSIFLFLSNTGEQAIMKKTTNTNYKQTYERRKLTLKEMEEVIWDSLYTDINGLQHSSLVKNSLVSAYIPFFPLERTHVLKCIVDGLFSKGFYEFEYQIDHDTVELIADSLLYTHTVPKQSVSGCKRVMEKIGLHMQHETSRHN